MATEVQPTRPEPASRTLTFLFTDIEGSTRLWEQHQKAMKLALERHDAIMRTAVESSRGQVVKTIGDGFMAVFDSAVDGVCACLGAQQDLVSEPWGETGPLRVRMGLHAGEAAAREGDYFGPTLNRTARIMSAGHGGQVLLSAAAAALVVDQLPDGAALQDLGEHQLKGLGRAERVFQLTHPNLQDSFPPLVTPTRRRTRLPDQPSGFVGRETELSEIAGRLADDSIRLLTLTGPGGIGKTRLALRAAADEIDRFADGVFFVDLAAARDSESVLGAIAGAIGFEATAAESLLGELQDRLRDEHVLLILDNFEQVTAAAPTVAHLMRDCERLKVLVTSREALHVSGEHLFAVPPLSLPEAVRGRPSAEQLAGYEAIQLFVERAQAVKPDFRLTDDNAAAVAEICLRLDGLPLALELATARINLFSPEALLERLDSSLQLLRSGPRDRPERQQTLRAAIEWSYELLEPGEQRLFELLAAFSGATFDAVEAVAAALNGRLGLDPLDGLASLVDKSLVRQAGANGDSRLVMLATISEYAAERLHQSPEFDAAARRAHAAHFADLARREWEGVTGDRRDAALTALTADAENLRRAWRHWVGDGDLDQLDPLIDGLWVVYESQGRYQGMADLAGELLDVVATTPPTRERALQELTLRTSRARALMGLHGLTDEVEEEYRRALALFEGEREVPQLFPVLRGLAGLHGYRAEFDKALPLGYELLALADAQHSETMRVDAHLMVGTGLAFTNDIERGLEHLEHGIRCFESQRHGSHRFQLGANPGIACYTTAGLIWWLRGFPDRALDRANRAVALAMELQHPFTMAYALHHTGFLHLLRQEPEPLRERAVGLLDVADEYELPIWRAVGTVMLGAAKTDMGHFDAGLAEIADGLAQYQGLRSPPVFWPLLMYVRARACARAGQPREGLGFIDEAIEISGGEGTLPPLFFVTKGDLLLALPDRGDGAEWFRRGVDQAAELGAGMPQLRAAVGLCRAQPTAENRELLRGIQATFTEGFATPDLAAAAAVLAQPAA
ncbi:MAG TPA: adenylate/guanylate cyclase domain-containing protein [Solirubrobacterales bacterium]|nr:adenylate/guanylate cyclase domain-containing protein [Solirubrobacterales bacterium]